MNMSLPFSISLSNPIITEQVTLRKYTEVTTPGGGAAKDSYTDTTIRAMIEELDDYAKTYWGERFGPVDMVFWVSKDTNVERGDQIIYDGDTYDVMHVETYGHAARCICRKR